jgi:hypothetical protein
MAVRERLLAFDGADTLRPAAVAEYRRVLLTLARELPSNLEVWSLERVVNSYSGAKRAAYAAALERASRDGITYTAMHRQKVMTKIEVTKRKWLGAGASAQYSYLPRPIIFPDLAMSLWTGAMVKPLEGALFRHLLNPDGSALLRSLLFQRVSPIVKGVSVITWGALCTAYLGLDLVDPVQFRADIVKFDAHVTKPLHDAVHAFAREAYRRTSFRALLAEWYGARSQCSEHWHVMTKDLAIAMAWSVPDLGIQVVFDDGETENIEHRLGSGRGSTSAFGNMTTMAIMLMALALWRAKYGATRPLFFLINGDEVAGAISRAYFADWMELLVDTFLSLGFRTDAGEAVPLEGQPEAFEFCSSHPLRVGDHYQMVTDPIKGIASALTLPYDARLNIRRARAHFHARGIGLRHLYAGVPVFDALGRFLVRIAAWSQSLDDALRTANLSSSERWEWETDVTPNLRNSFEKRVEEDTRISFEAATGLSRAEQLMYEAVFDEYEVDWENFTTLPFQCQ